MITDNLHTNSIYTIRKELLHLTDLALSVIQDAAGSTLFDYSLPG